MFRRPATITTTNGDFEIPDISMCNNSQCPKAEICFRHRAQPNPYRQTFARFVCGDNGCESFYPVSEIGGYPLRPFVKDANENHRG